MSSGQDHNVDLHNNTDTTFWFKVKGAEGGTVYYSVEITGGGKNIYKPEFQDKKYDVECYTTTYKHSDPVAQSSPFTVTDSSKKVALSESTPGTYNLAVSAV